MPPNHEQSNYRLAEECLIRPAKIRNVHRIPAELTPKQAAKRYSTDIREHFQVNEGELPHFDVVHLGIGPDAHMASLFPGEPLIADRQGLAAAVYVEKIPQWRITLLPGVLLAARNMVILAAGGDKREPLEHILNGQYDPLLLPGAGCRAAGAAADFLPRSGCRTGCHGIDSGDACFLYTDSIRSGKLLTITVVGEVALFHSLHLHRAALALLCLSASVVYGQFVSGSIGGRIVDPTGAPVAEADIKLIHSQTGRISSAKSNATGEFQFPAVPSGEYNVQIEKTGFQTFERRNTNLSANERLSLGDIALVLGSVAERVVVEAESTPVQTASSERSAQLTSNQINRS